MQRLVDKRRDLGNRAPIIEALVDIRTVVSQDIELPDLKLFNEPFEADYPTRKQQEQFQGQISFGPKGGETAFRSQSTIRGFQFWSVDGRNVVQVRRDGFTFSRLKPYESWKALRDEAERLWLRYLEVAQPETVSRVAVRYINEISLPAQSDTVDLSDILAIHPEFPDSIGIMSDFEMRVLVQSPQLEGCRAIVGLSSTPVRKDGRRGIRLDIDAFLAKQFEATDSGVWSALDGLREFKNDLFFGTVLENALVELS